MISKIVRAVDFCRRRALFVALVALVTGIAMCFHVAQTIRINTNIDDLLGDGLEWRDLEQEMARAFPQNADRLVIVIDGANPDLAEDASLRLAAALREKQNLFKTVTRPDAIPYFRTNGLLFFAEEKLTELLENLIKAQPFLGSLARDPSLRGLFATMGLTAEGIKRGEATYDALAPSYALMAEALEATLSSRAVKLPWQSMMSGAQPKLRDLRKFILTQPVLDFSALSPGNKATKEVRRLADEMGLTKENGVTVRLTGSVALNDEEFASVADGMELSLILSFALVVALLYLALHSWKLIVPIALTLLLGLIATTSFAMLTVGSLNLISVAFAVMFLGIAVDFGIQFGVRFREEKHLDSALSKAMKNTARGIVPPLAFAAAATTLGFIAFIPTDYRGVSELGIIAAGGMIIALFLNLTVLPALLTLFAPDAEPEGIGYKWAAPLDRFLIKRRKYLFPLIAALALAGGLGATQIRFDFDPLNLKNPKTESVATMFEIMKDPDATPYTIAILAANLDEAKALAAKIGELPEVDHTITLASFVPEDQEAKLALIQDAKSLLAPSLNPAEIMPAPTPEEIAATFRATAKNLQELGPDKAEALRLSKLLEEAAGRTKDGLFLKDLHKATIDGVVIYLNQIRTLLGVHRVTVEDIGEDLRRDWMTPDGRAKIEVYPKGDARDHKILEAFTQAVRKVAPRATGTPISIQESGRTIVNAFIQAGLLALLFIALLAYAVLRRIGDVFLLLAPLILAGILTLATMVALPLPLNFANIIGLPLLLSLGVSYAIYFVTYWRDGKTKPLSSSMARAVLFSAATTFVAFGSLSLSSHTGTQGMGQLLTIALIYSVLCTFLVLPVLLGRPR